MDQEGIIYIITFPWKERGNAKHIKTRHATKHTTIEIISLHQTKQQKANNQLEILIANDASLDLIAIQRENELRESTARWKLAFQKNAVSQVEWDQRVQRLSELLYNLETSNNQREQLINEGGDLFKKYLLIIPILLLVIVTIILKYTNNDE